MQRWSRVECDLHIYPLRSGVNNDLLLTIDSAIALLYSSVFFVHINELFLLTDGIETCNIV